MREELDQVRGWKNEMEKKISERREDLDNLGEGAEKERREQEEERNVRNRKELEWIL